MKKLFWSLVLVLSWSISAQAAVVYLKDGGQIKSLKVWRDKGTVVALVNRYAIASFATSEINMKKTFPPRKKRVKIVKESSSVPPAVAPASGADVTVKMSGQPQKSGTRLSLPRLPGKLPELEIPKGTQEGTLRKQKKEMEKRLNE
jgi:hypothetical protein